jgi:hypothetical protein
MPLDASDVTAIQQLYAAYNIAADRGDGKAFAGCFTTDGVFDIGGMNRLEGAVAISEFAQSIPAHAPGSRHIAANILVEGDGDLASGLAYFVLLDSQSSPPAVKSTGQYADRLMRTPEGWRFSERCFTPDTAAT